MCMSKGTNFYGSHILMKISIQSINPRKKYFHVLPASYSPFLLRCSLLPVSIVTQKSYNKSIIAIPWVGQSGEIYRIGPRYRPSLQSGRYGPSHTEYFLVLPSQSDWSVRGQYFPIFPARYCTCL